MIFLCDRCGRKAEVAKPKDAIALTLEIKGSTDKWDICCDCAEDISILMKMYKGNNAKKKI